MDENGMKKAGVVAIVILLALYSFGYVVLIALLEASVLAVVIYGVIALGFILLLAYEGWLRIKEIDEGLEDAVDDY